jgi:hypothetical protein
MAKSKLSLTQKAKLAKEKASGTKEVQIRKKPSVLEDLSGTPMSASRKAKVLNKAGKVRKIVADQGMSGPYNERIVVKKVDSDAYDMLSNLAKGKALKGVEAERAIQKAYKAVARTAGAERQRTATRGAAQVKRGSEKRSNTNLG